MHPHTPHGVGVITKLYFAIFVPFKESMTLNFARQRSYKVIDSGTNRKHILIRPGTYINTNLDPMLHRFIYSAFCCQYVSINSVFIRRLKCWKSTIDFFVCLFLCQQDYNKTAGPICMKFSGKVWSDHGTAWLNLGSIRANGSAGHSKAN